MSLSHEYVQDHLLSMHRLNPAERAALEAHLAACPDCRAYDAFHQTLRQTLPLPAGAMQPEQDLREKIQSVRSRVEKRRWPAQMARHTLAFTGGAVVVLALIFIIFLSVPRLVPALTQATRIPAGQATASNWLTYQDPQNRFTLQYPASYTVTSAAGRLGTLQLTSPAMPDQPAVKINIGIYNKAIDASDDFDQWLDDYNSQSSDFTPDQLQTHQREALQVDGLPALHIVQTSPMGDYQYTAVRRPGEVWFIWSNIGWSAKPEDEAIYQAVLRSLKFKTASQSTQTPTAVRGTSTPLPSAGAALASFPMDPGTIWVYNSTQYAQAGSDPEKILRKTMKIEEKIVDTQSVSPFTILHIQGSRTVVSTEPGWYTTGIAADNGGNYEYWYVIQNNQIFRSDVKPDPASMDPAKTMLLEFQFPMSAGSEWCHNPFRRGTVENPTPPPDAPCESRRVVMRAAPYPSPIGDLPACYEVHDVITSGDLITQYCDGVGIVAVKNDHMGTQFGMDQELIQFTDGKDGTARRADMVSATPYATQTATDTVQITSPDGRWTAVHERKTGIITLTNAQGQTTRLAAGDQDQYLVPGSWSPDSRYLLFWQGTNSASIQADGLPLWSVAVDTGKTFRIAQAVLVNPGYLSWAPDGHALVFTNGGYRSAQVGKWLSLYTPADQQVSELVPQEKLVPGLVAWSPDGKTIAFAAVDATQTGQAYADFSGWENPAILARRIYTLDPQTGTYQRLNAQEAFQDAPRWDPAGRLYFVQLAQTLARVMWVSDLAAGVAYAVPGCQGARLTPAGFYGQIDWGLLFDACPATKASGGIMPTPPPTLINTPPKTQNRVVPAVALQGQTAFVGIGSRLAAIDLSRPDAPQLAAQSQDLPGEVIKVLSLPGGAGQRVAASAGRYLALLDTSSATALPLISQSKLPGPITALIADISTQDLYAGGVLDGDASKGFVARLIATAPDTLQLLGTSQLSAPVQSVALANGVLYVALTGDPPRVAAVPIRENALGEPTDVIIGTSVASMTITGNLLFIGTDGQMLAYDLTQPQLPQLAWQISEVNKTPVPGTILGFEVRPNTIFTAGRDAAGAPFHLAMTPPAPLKTGSMVDTASCVAVSNGQMLVAGDRLEIYDNRDPQNLKLIGSYSLTAP